MSESDRLNNVSFTTAVCVEKEGQLLMVQKQTGKWGLPAGHLHNGETVLEAARREAIEEAGVDIVPYALLGVYFFPKRQGLSICVVVRAYIDPEATVESRDEEIKQVEWKDQKWILYAIKSERIHRPEYTVNNLMDWLCGVVYPLALLREFPGSWLK